MTRSSCCAALVSCLVAFGCAESTDERPLHGPETDPVVTCEADPRVQPFFEGLQLRGRHAFGFVLRTAAPAPPLVGTNSWELSISDPSGMAFGSGRLTVRASMPDHGHGATWTDTSPINEHGEVEVHELDLFMPGVWRVTLEVTEDDVVEPTDTATFTFCVEG
jgi:hypothetical protein